MAVYRRETRVDAPIESVWEFYSTADGLVALTPDWMHLRIESVVGPGGDHDPEVLRAGTEVQVSVRPFGLGPRQGWTTRIVERRREDAAAVFRDRMVDGPFDRWIHTHSFYADDGGTIVRDRVEYELPMGPVGSAVGPLAVVGFEPMFRHRHRRTRELLADETGD